MTIQRDVLGWVQTLPVGEIFTVERVCEAFNLNQQQAASALANQLRNYAGMPYERVGRGTYRRIISPEPIPYLRTPHAIEQGNQTDSLPTPDVQFVGRSQSGEVLVLVDGVVGKVVPV